MAAPSRAGGSLLPPPPPPPPKQPNKPPPGRPCRTGPPRAFSGPKACLPPWRGLDRSRAQSDAEGLLPLGCKAQPVRVPVALPESWAKPLPSSAPEPKTPPRVAKSPAVQTPPKPCKTEPKSPSQAQVEPAPPTAPPAPPATSPQGTEAAAASPGPSPPAPRPPGRVAPRRMFHPHYTVKTQLCERIALTNLPRGAQERHVARQLEENGLDSPFLLQILQDHSCVVYYPSTAESLKWLLKERQMLLEHEGEKHMLKALLLQPLELIWMEPSPPGGQRGHGLPPPEPSKPPVPEPKAEAHSIQKKVSDEDQGTKKDEALSKALAPDSAQVAKTGQGSQTGSSPPKRRRVEPEEPSEPSRDEAAVAPSTPPASSQEDKKPKEDETEEPEFSHEYMIQLIDRLLLTNTTPMPRAGPKSISPLRRLRRFCKKHGKLWSGRRRRRKTKKQESGELGKLEELGELDGAEAEGGKDERKPREPDQPPRWKRRREESDDWDFVRDIPVSQLRFSQRSCGAYFQCGRKCLDLVQDLHSGKVNPLTANFLILDAFSMRDKKGRPAIWSSDNRRLYALKKFQEYTKGEVRVRVRWQGDFEAFQRFKANLDTDSQGRSIRFREESHKKFWASGGWPTKRRRAGRR